MSDMNIKFIAHNITDLLIIKFFVEDQILKCVLTFKFVQ